MKQMIVLVSVMVFSVAMFAGCDSKGKDCAKLYDKGMSCVKEAKMVPSKEMGDKSKFVKECKENYKEAKELMKMDCKMLAEVFGDEAEEKKPEGDMPADMPAEKPAEPAPAEKPAEPAPADMPAEPAPADMPAEEAK